MEDNLHRPEWPNQSPMKYYSEEKMWEVRSRFDQEVLRWPSVTTKKMLGCPSYLASGQLFAFLVSKGVVITRLSPKDRESLHRRFKVSPFQAGKKTARNWIRVSVDNERQLAKMMPYVRKSYASAV